MMTLDDIRRLGPKRYFDGLGVYRNPHSMGSPEFTDFERGWMQSLRRDDGRFISKRNRN